MNKKDKILFLGTICLAILGGVSFWYTSSHTASLKSQALGEGDEMVFQMLHETCLNEIVNLGPETPLTSICVEELTHLVPRDTTLTTTCVTEIKSIAHGETKSLSDICRVELYSFFNLPENTSALLESNITNTQSRIDGVSQEISILEGGIATLTTNAAILAQNLTTATTAYTEKYNIYLAKKTVYENAVREHTRLKKISDKNKNVIPAKNIQKQISDLEADLAKNKRKTAAEKAAYTKAQIQITELKNVVATNTAKKNMDDSKIAMDEVKKDSDLAETNKNDALRATESNTQSITEKTNLLELKKSEKQNLESQKTIFEGQRVVIDNSDTFGHWDENIDFGPDFDGIVIDVVADILEKHNFIYDNAGDKILFETRIQEMKDLISKQEFGAIKLMLWPEEKVEDKTQYSIAYSENQKTYRVVEMFIIPYNDVNSEIRDGAYKKKFNKNIALNNLRKGGTCALQSILKLRLGACGDASTLVSGDKWNEDAANKIVKDAWGGSDVDPKSTDKSKKDYSFSREETKLALEKNGFKNCRRISSDEFCKNIKTEKSNFCILHVNSSTGGHAMPIYGAKNSIFGSCKIVVEDTGNQGDETGMPVNPGYQMWGPGGLEQPTSNIWDGYKPAEVTCCESACNG